MIVTISKITEFRSVDEEHQRYANPLTNELWQWVQMRVSLENGDYFFTPKHLLVCTGGVRGSKSAVAFSHAWITTNSSDWWVLGEEKTVENEGLKLVSHTIPYAPTIKVGDSIEIKCKQNGKKLTRVKLVR